MLYYLKVNPETHIIEDTITYPYEEYIPVELEVALVGLYGGWFKFENGEVVEYPELKPKSEKDVIQELKDQILELQAAVSLLMERTI